MAATATIFKRSNYYGANSSFLSFIFAQAEEMLKWIENLFYVNFAIISNIQ